MMTAFLMGLMVGLFIGGSGGLVLAGLLIAAKRADEAMEAIGETERELRLMSSPVADDDRVPMVEGMVQARGIHVRGRRPVS